MPALFVFLLKINIALLIFCLGYYLVLRKLTFYTLNRFYLVLGILFSSAYPFIDINKLLQPFKRLAIPAQQVALNWKAPAEKLAGHAVYWHWAAMIFWAGAAIFAARLLIQLISLYKVYRSSKPGTVQQYKVRITAANISPFSFWQSIFINPDNIETGDLKSILQHEQIHVNEWHTLDILLAEISVIFYWFNPGIWLMKKAVSENIEFITDRKILQKGIDSKAYQYSLLNVSLGANTSPNITNHFNFSTLKKRIRMMNARRSSNINLTRYALLVPAVLICLGIFGVTKAEIVKKSKVAYKTISTSVHNMVTLVATRPAEKVKKKLIHKLIVQVTDTAGQGPLGMTIQFKNDSTAKRNQTFEVSQSSGRPTAYIINGRHITGEEFKALKPNLNIDTIKVVANYQPDKQPGKRIFAIRLKSDKDHDEGFPGDWPTRHLDSAAKMPTYVTFKRRGASADDDKSRLMIHADGFPDGAVVHPPVMIRKVMINGKDATADDLKKLQPSILEKIQIIDINRASKDTAKRDLSITTKKAQ
ncbi:M56 family metallopeptidase [Mucilaginibacter sp. dw_454]|uniref:M56 family metallopeptidase n=1 Tax=Mucilaginibacter sp. dw_454 TaxID=2720079 RepID=UPI001BD2CF10|nr:M56 family metallopeptidase [Mucilaginibacter sp. dw_454]